MFHCRYPRRKRTQRSHALKSKQHRRRLVFEPLEDRRLLAGYTWTGASNLLISLETNESLTVSESAGQVSFMLDSGVFAAQIGSDIASGDGSDTIVISAAELLGFVQITNTGAAAGTNNVTFIGPGAMTSGQIGVSLLEDLTAGAIAMVDGFRFTATADGGISLESSGDITLGEVIASSVDAVVRISAGGAIIDGNGTGTNISASSAALRATTGIGSGDELETAVTNLAFSNITSGDVRVTNTGALILAQVDGITESGNGGGGITVRAASPLTVNAPISDSGGGSIVLAAEGATAADDLTINANITATGGNGSISLFAGDSVEIAAGTTVSTAGTGAVLVSAGTNYNSGTPVNGTNSGSVVMQDGATLASEDGNITLLAPGNILLGVVSANSDGDAAGGEIVVTADYDGVAGGLSNGSGAIADNTINESANLISTSAVRLTAASGIGGALDSDIDVQAARLQATNTTSNNVHLSSERSLELANLGAGHGLSSVAGAFVSVAGRLAISGNITVGAASIFQTIDSAAPGEDLAIAGGVVVQGGGLLSFFAGDNFVFPGSATINNPADTVVVIGDAGDADVGVGASITWAGSVTATQVVLNGGSDNDTFTVQPSINTPIVVNGLNPMFGDPGVPPGDRLIVSLGGTTGAVVPAVPPANGMVTFASHQSITFTSIETLRAIGPDALEPNDTIATATLLGSPVEVTLTNLTVSPSSDVDFFKYTAHHTGKLIVRILFEHVVGDLALEVQDMSGDVIASVNNSSDTRNLEELILPVISQQMYFVRVSGFEGAVNSYMLEIENFAAPVPTQVDLVAASDLGRLSSDNITSDATPTFRIQADLVDYRDSGITLLDAATIDPNGDGNATDSTAAGAGVFVTLVNFDTGDVVSGFANPVGTGGFLWSFTVPDAVALTNGEYFVSAAVQIVDNQQPRATGRTQLSQPLTLLIDTRPPFVSFGTSVSMFDGLHPTSDTSIPSQPDTLVDRITSDTTPTFWGVAEANATVRVYVRDAANNLVLIGETVATPGGGNNVGEGRWTLTSSIDMNDPLLGFTELDGLRQFEVFAEDIAGNVTEISDTLEVFFDTQGPVIAAVQIAGNPDFDLFGLKGAAALPPIGGPTPPVNGLTIQFQDFPNRIDGFLYPAVNQTQALTPGNYRLVGQRVGIVPITSVVFADGTVAGGPGLASVTLMFASPLPDDRYTLTVFDNIRDTAGNRLDGEFAGFDFPVDDDPFPSGDLVPGGDFVVQFTVDSLPEIGVWSAGTVLLDANGNSRMDGGPGDLAFDLGFSSDYIFSGNFVDRRTDPNAVANGFDKLAAYGRVGSQWRWIVDFTGTGQFAVVAAAPQGINGIPVAGNFDGNAANGDEVGVFTGTHWYLDTTGDFHLDTVIAAQYAGFPMAGDFDGDGDDDLATYIASQNIFFIDLNTAGAGSPITINGVADNSFRIGLSGAPGGFHGFPGVRERPVAADMNGDGFADIGLWVPDGSALVPSELGEWYFFLSDPVSATSVLNRIVADPTAGNFLTFRPSPLGNDLYFQFGNSFALPVVGNFDPPSTPSTATPAKVASASAVSVQASTATARTVVTSPASTTTAAKPSRVAIKSSEAVAKPPTGGASAAESVPAPAVSVPATLPPVVANVSAPVSQSPTLSGAASTSKQTVGGGNSTVTATTATGRTARRALPNLQTSAPKAASSAVNVQPTAAVPETSPLPSSSARPVDDGDIVNSQPLPTVLAATPQEPLAVAVVELPQVASEPAMKPEEAVPVAKVVESSVSGVRVAVAAEKRQSPPIAPAVADAAFATLRIAPRSSIREPALSALAAAISDGRADMARRKTNAPKSRLAVERVWHDLAVRR